MPSLNKLIIILMIPANKPSVTATSEGVIEGLILTTELTTVLTSNDTVAVCINEMSIFIFFFLEE